MQTSEKNKWATGSLFVILITMVCGVSYYLSSDYYQQTYPEGREEFDFSGRPVQLMATTDQIILKKDQKVIIGRTCLVFKGVVRKMIVVDLYILDMDSEQAFEKRFLKKNAKKEMLLGGGRYRLLSVNAQNLILKNLTIH